RPNKATVAGSGTALTGLIVASIPVESKKKLLSLPLPTAKSIVSPGPTDTPAVKEGPGPKAVTSPANSETPLCSTWTSVVGGPIKSLPRNATSRLNKPAAGAVQRITLNCPLEPG